MQMPARQPLQILNKRYRPAKIAIRAGKQFKSHLCDLVSKVKTYFTEVCRQRGVPVKGKEFCRIVEGLLKDLYHDNERKAWPTFVLHFVSWCVQMHESGMLVPRLTGEGKKTAKDASIFSEIEQLSVDLGLPVNCKTATLFHDAMTTQLNEWLADESKTGVIFHTPTMQHTTLLLIDSVVCSRGRRPCKLVCLMQDLKALLEAFAEDLEKQHGLLPQYKEQQWQDSWGTLGEMTAECPAKIPSNEADSDMKGKHKTQKKVLPLADCVNMNLMFRTLGPSYKQGFDYFSNTHPIGVMRVPVPEPSLEDSPDDIKKGTPFPKLKEPYLPVTTVLVLRALTTFAVRSRSCPPNACHWLYLGSDCCNCSELLLEAVTARWLLM